MKSATFHHLAAVGRSYGDLVDTPHKLPLMKAMLAGRSNTPEAREHRRAVEGAEPVYARLLRDPGLGKPGPRTPEFLGYLASRNRTAERYSKPRTGIPDMIRAAVRTATIRQLVREALDRHGRR